MYFDRRPSDQLIIKHLLAAIFKAGFAVNVDTGDEDEELPHPTTDHDTAWNVIGETDMDRIYVYETPDSEKPFGWILLVFGNGIGELISDYTVNLEKIIGPTNLFADGLSDTITDRKRG